MAAFELLLDVAYLARLIGIKSILIGGAASVILIPLSTRLSRRHRNLQAELSKSHDGVSNITSEALQGLHQIRLSSMEHVWEGRILDARARELERIWRAGVTLAFLSLIANLSPILLASVALSAYSFEAGHLSPAVAFASLSLFGSVHRVVRDLPMMAANLHQSWISCQRIQRYLEEPEKTAISVPSSNICLEEATLTWPGGDRCSPSPTTVSELRDVSLEFPKAKLSIITGKTGSGKSLLVASLLEEAKLISGRIGKPTATMASVEEKIVNDGVSAGTAIALVSQPPWIENRTIKDNILFGYPFDEARYRKVLHACALDHDLDALPLGDLTMAGVNGGALSGGQKWRVALARALFSPAETLVLEDVISAVDAPVARWICDHALTGELAEGRTRILVTHHPEACFDAASYLVVVQDAAAIGSRKAEAKLVVSDRELAELPAPMPEHPEAKSKPSIVTGGRPRHYVSRNNWQIFRAYLWSAGGVGACTLIMLASVAYQLASASHSWWLARWTARQEASKNNLMLYNIGVYLALSIGDGAALAVQSFVITRIGLAPSRLLFQRMVQSILTATLGWIDKTPLGNVLQSLGGDMYLIDHRTASEINGLLGNIARLVLIVFAR
jgi:ABC-type multidrug transport system fused ATPase/permease subunit